MINTVLIGIGQIVIADLPCPEVDVGKETVVCCSGCCSVRVRVESQVRVEVGTQGIERIIIVCEVLSALDGIQVAELQGIVVVTLKEVGTSEHTASLADVSLIERCGIVALVTDTLKGESGCVNTVAVHELTVYD